MAALECVDGHDTGVSVHTSDNLQQANGTTVLVAEERQARYGNPHGIPAGFDSLRRLHFRRGELDSSVSHKHAPGGSIPPPAPTLRKEHYE